MKSRTILIALAIALVTFSMPALAVPGDGDEPENQDFNDPGNGTGWFNCWECVPSLSRGYECRREYIGFNGCQRTETFSTNPDGTTSKNINCTVVPYGFCVTITP